MDNSKTLNVLANFKKGGVDSSKFEKYLYK